MDTFKSFAIVAAILLFFNTFSMQDPASVLYLQTSNGKIFTINYELAIQSETIKQLLRDTKDTENVIPLPSVDENCIPLLLHYLNIIYLTNIGAVDTSTLYTELQHLSFYELKQLIGLSSYLYIPLLLQASVNEYAIKLTEHETLQLFFEDQNFFTGIFSDILDLPVELLNMITDAIKSNNNVIHAIINLLINKNDYATLKLEGHNQRVIKVLSNLTKQSILSVGEDRTINVWNNESKELTNQIETPYNFIDAKLSYDGAYLATRCSKGSIQIWDMETNIVLDEFPNSVCFAWNPKLNYLAVVNKNSNEIIIWGASEKAVLKNIENNEAPIQTIDWCPTEHYLATGSIDNIVRIWDIEKSKCIGILKGHTEKISSVSYNPQGTLLATIGDDKKICIWNAYGELVREFSGHTHWIWDAKWNPTGEHLATCSHDKTIRIWNIQTGESQCLLGHLNRVWTISWSPDGLHLASGATDTTVRIWNATTGDCIKILEGHAGLILSLDWINNFEVISGSGDHHVHIWKLLDESLINLTLDQLIVLLYLGTFGHFDINNEHHLYPTYSTLNTKFLELFK